MNNQLINNLETLFQSEISESEERYLDLFCKLNESCKEKLSNLLASYLAGLFQESKKFKALKLVEGIDNIIENAKKIFQEKSGLNIENSYEAQLFVLCLEYAISQKETLINDLVVENNNIVFEKKADMNLLMEELKVLDDFMLTNQNKSH